MMGKQRHEVIGQPLMKILNPAYEDEEPVLNDFIDKVIHNSTGMYWFDKRAYSRDKVSKKKKKVRQDISLCVFTVQAYMLSYVSI
jgi:hypothetical protein